MIEIRGMKPDELPEVHQMLDRAFPGTPGSFFNRQVENDPFLRPEDTRILLENGTILSSVRIYFRDIYCQDQIIRIGGIGDVGTDPGARHKGYASRMMEDAVRHIRRNNAVLSILFTRIPAFYHQFGFMSLPTLHIQTEPPQYKTKMTYRTADLKQDLDQLRKLYTDFNRNKTGPVVRTASYWEKQIHFPRIDPGLFWIAEDRNRIRGYVRGKIEDEQLKIQEWAYAQGQEESVKSLISEMADTMHKKKVHLLYLSEQEATLFHEWPVESEENRALMIRLIQLDKRSFFSRMLKPLRFLFWESDRF